MITNNYSPIRQLGNGVTVAFSQSWQMISATYASVFLEDATTGVQTPVAQGGAANQYQIVINASGFIVTFGTAPTTTQYAVIGRSTPLDQTTPYSTSTGFQGKVEENSFDKLTALAQETQQLVSRSITAPVGDIATLVMPTATLRANKFLAFDAAGNVIVASGASGGTAISAAMVPVVQAASIAVAQGLLGISATKPTIQKFLSGSGTYTLPANVKWIRVRLLGGGGGGAGSSDVTENGGTGGNATATTFGSALLSAGGGIGSTGGGPGTAGPGGTSSLGGATGFAITGGMGSGGQQTNTAGAYASSGCGGSSALGGAGGGGVASGAGNAASANTGGGGGGASGPNAGQSNSGGGGGAGGYVEAVITSPAATYAYAVGAAGSAGIAGTNGFAGGAGSAGFIIVEEHYNA